MEIILICIKVFQEYINDNILNLLLFNNNVTVIIDRGFELLLTNTDKIKIIYSDEFDLTYFDAHIKLDGSFRNGFWQSTSKRLFYLYEYMLRDKIKNAIHIENDVLIYFNGNDLHFTDNLYLVLDSPNRVIPSIIYIPSSDHLKDLVHNYDYTQNDMVNMCLYYYRNITRTKLLPIMIHKESEFDGIFDGAAIGQYLGGIDPRNLAGDTKGFINETCVVKYNNYTFEWIEVNSLYVPHIVINNCKYPIYNLHIHSKQLRSFLSNTRQSE